MSFLFLRPFTKPSSSAPSSQAGFGLVELLVSISIMVIVVSIVLVQQNTFNGAVLLRGQAYEVALDVREVQLAAVSATGDVAADFRAVLGLHFSSAEVDQGGYRIFADADDDFYFDGDEVYGPQGVLDKRFFIGEIRAADGTVLPSVSVVFERPNFDAQFYTAANTKLDTSAIEIDIRRHGQSGDGSGAVRTLEITQTGQIGIQPITP